MFLDGVSQFEKNIVCGFIGLCRQEPVQRSRILASGVTKWRSGKILSRMP
jgi:hypothetical protein